MDIVVLNAQLESEEELKKFFELAFWSAPLRESILAPLSFLSSIFEKAHEVSNTLVFFE